MDRRPSSIFGQPAVPASVTVISETANSKVAQPVADILNETSKPLVASAVTVKSTSTAITVAKKISEDEIMKLGNDSGKTISTISGRILELHKGSNQGEMSDKLDDLIKNCKGLSSENFKGGLVNKLMNKVLNVKYDFQSRFDTAKDKVDHLIAELDKEKGNQVTVSHNVDDLIKGNALYCQALINEIEMGKQMLSNIADEIAQYNADQLSAEEAHDYNEAKSRYDLLEKKLVDLEGFKVLSMNMDPKLVAMKSGVQSLINTFDTITGKMVPAYMMQFADWLNAQAIKRGTELANNAEDAFDTIIKESGDQSAKNMVEIGKLKNRQMVSVDTLRQDHEKMIEGLTQLRAIDEQARKDRAQTMNDLRDLEQKTIAAFSRT
jgi:uncharacterized protein YaaN involved in tellurite resistance